ncbi:MAG: hypothetical protein FD123_206 [Bacteroidetes bacterium]|nr:MAG: hypothetical protein FD123_206 [Bacteroidota bacterium]
MKNIAIALLLTCSTGTTYAQITTPLPHSISVIGTAEMEIIPDEIYVSISITEFTKDKKKYLVEELEKSMVNFIETVTATPRKEISMDDLDADLIALKRKSKKDAVITKSYEVKFKEQKQVSKLFAAMDSLNISSAYVVRYSHSKMDEFKKQIKIDAIKAAKTKAEYLLTAIGSRAGKPLSVVEPSGFVTIDDGTYRPFRGNTFQYNGSYLENNSDKEDIGGESSIGGKKIKLHYSINAEFEIL